MSFKAFYTSHKKYIVIALITFIVCFIGLSTLSNRFKLCIDTQKVRSMNTRVYLLDTQNKEIIKGNIYAFKTPKKLLEANIFTDKPILVKRAVATVGDNVKVDDNLDFFINDEKVDCLPLLNRKLIDKNTFEKIKRNFIGSKNLQKGEIWFMGENVESLDSRYWGIVEEQNVIGRAYALF